MAVTAPDGAAAPDLVRAPWTAGQVASLNAYQESGKMHPFTCGNDDCPGVRGMHASLVAAEDGWHCPGCEYTQDWAHRFMAEWREDSAAAPGQAAYEAVESPNKPRPDSPLIRDIADALRRIENNYQREGSGPGSRFEGKLLEDVQAQRAVSMVRAADAQVAQNAIAAEAAQPAVTWAEWYLADREGRTMTQDLNESKHDAMRRAFKAGTEAAAAAQPAPTRAELETAMAAALQDLIDEDEAAEPGYDVDGLRNALLAIKMGIAEPPPRTVAENALDGRYFDPMRDAGVWHATGLHAVPAEAAQPAPGDDLRAALESLARFWVREYVTADGWPDVCAKQLLDVLGGAREPAAPAAAPELLPPPTPGSVYTPDGKYEIPVTAPAAAPELDTAMAESRGFREAPHQVARMADAPGAARQTGNIAKVARNALEGK